MHELLSIYLAMPMSESINDKFMCINQYDYKFYVRKQCSCEEHGLIHFELSLKLNTNFYSYN